MPRAEGGSGGNATSVGGLPVDLTGHMAGYLLVLDPTNTKIIATSAPPSGVLSVTASGVLSSSGGANPNITLTGVIPIANLSVGTSSSTVAVGNDSRFNPTPSVAGKIPVDTGSAYSTITVGSSVQVLHGGATPGFSAVDLSTDVTGQLPISNGGTGSATGDLVATNSLTTPLLTSLAALAITAPAGSGSGTGSAISTTAGQGGATGFGGAVAITAGAGGSTSGTGGAVTITAGAGAGSTSGGGGAITVSGGAGGPTTGGGGVARLFGGAATAGNSSGGGAQVVAGSSKGSSSGGSATITGGAADTTGIGGAVLISGGVGGTTSGAGGLAQMLGGNATVGSGANGGAATLQAGNGREAGAGGATTLRGGNGGTSGLGGAVDINGGTGATTNGAVNIATTNASVVTIGKAGGSISLGQGTVTQATSVTTGVTLNASSGVITTFSQSAAAGATSTFTVTNSCVLVGSVVGVTVGNYAGTYVTNGIPLATVSSVSAGSFNVTVINAHGSNALSGALKLNFSVL